MTFPSVLLIGAMKAGTTSLYFDLAEHPDVFLCGDKEPHALCSDHVLSEQGRREYAKVYAAAKDRQILIDASTGDSPSKLPKRVVPDRGEPMMTIGLSSCWGSASFMVSFRIPAAKRPN